MAYNTKGIHQNKENNLDICKRLVNIRRQHAQLMGYRTYADFVMVHRMASSSENVYKLLNNLLDAYRPTAEKERQEIEAMAQELEGPDFKLEPWDLAYYTHSSNSRNSTSMPRCFGPILNFHE